MAFHGDLFSFPLPDLLQWLDASRKTGTLDLEWEAGARRLYLLGGQLMATASPALWERIARRLELGNLAEGQRVLAAFGQMRGTGEVESSFRQHQLDPRLAIQLAQDELYGAVADLVQAQGGQFHWTEDTDRTDDEWVPVELGIREVLFESLRWVDETAEVERALPQESMVVRAKVPPTEDLPLTHRVVLVACRQGLSLGKLRLALGTSRSSATRQVYELLRSGRVEVEGAPALEVDPVTEMLEKGAQLVRERQFEAATLVFGALLASDPTDRRVREFARMVEREHVAALYRELPPVLVPHRAEDPQSHGSLRPEERQVLSMVNGTWDVSTIVLASQRRELETLQCLRKLIRVGAIRPT